MSPLRFPKFKKTATNIIACVKSYAVLLTSFRKIIPMARVQSTDDPMQVADRTALANGLRTKHTL